MRCAGPDLGMSPAQRLSGRANDLSIGPWGRPYIPTIVCNVRVTGAFRGQRIGVSGGGRSRCRTRLRIKSGEHLRKNSVQ